MFTKLISHSWQMMRRSAFFEKSMFAKGFMAFIIFFAAMQLYTLGHSLPVVLNEHFPEFPPAKWVYGLLPLILLMDLSMRFFLQKIPARQVRAYLHLPIPRSTLSGYWMLRSWLHPMNIYLLFFFYPFIQMTINPATSNQSLGLAGIFLLTGINQSILMLLRTPGRQSRGLGLILLGILLTISASYLWMPSQMMQYSLDVFLAFVYVRPEAFLIPLGLIFVLHALVYRQTSKNFYQVYEAGEKEEKAAGSNALEQFLASVPVYGSYWLLEWRLLTRNKRTKSSMYFFLPAAIAYTLMAGFMITEPAESGMAIIFIIIAGGLGSMHLQHAYSWESHFFDLLASRDFSMEVFVKAKYYFYLIIALLQLILVSILLMFVNPQILFIFAGISLYAVGLGFYLFLRAGVRHSSRMDLQGKASFNMEGVSGMKLLMGMLQYLIIIPLFILGLLLPIAHGEALLTGLAGLLFILNHRSWTRRLGQRLEARKYINLALYREK